MVDQIDAIMILYPAERRRPIEKREEEEGVNREEKRTEKKWRRKRKGQKKGTKGRGSERGNELTEAERN